MCSVLQVANLVLVAGIVDPEQSNDREEKAQCQRVRPFMRCKSACQGTCDQPSEIEVVQMLPGWPASAPSLSSYCELLACRGVYQLAGSQAAAASRPGASASEIAGRSCPAALRRLVLAQLLEIVEEHKLQGSMRWLVAQKNQQRNGEIYRFIAGKRSVRHCVLRLMPSQQDQKPPLSCMICPEPEGWHIALPA